jgi:hypothetical protein
MVALSSAAKLEHELLATVSLLSSAQKREALDFITFIATQRRSKFKNPAPLRRKKQVQSIEAIFDLATDCKDTDLSVNHDKYLYGEDPL